DEMVAVDLLLGHCPGEAHPDVIVAILDASNLERHLYLTTQLLELECPVVIALNMVDVAKGQGIQVDAARLENQIGLPGFPIQANKGIGLDRLRQAIIGAARTDAPRQRPVFPPAFEQEVKALGEQLPQAPPFLLRRAVLDIDGYIQRRLSEEHGPQLGKKLSEARQRLAALGCTVPAVEAKTRFGWIRDAVAGCVQHPPQRPVTWTDRLDRILTHRVWGTLTFLALMFIVFQAIFTWARPLMKLIGDSKDALGVTLAVHLADGPLKSLLL